MNDIATRDGEIISGPVAMIDPAGALARAEINTQIATARAYPRPSDRVLQEKIADRACLDEETAEECLYTLIRGQKRQARGGRRQEEGASEERDNKPIEGPSIRLAEIAAQVYGNCRIDARVTHVNHAEGYVEAEGLFHDLETNMASRATVRRSIKGRNGLFSQDMQIVTGNAACAIAKRNAILAGIPKPLYRLAYQEARRMVSGTAEMLVENRAKVFKAFAPFGVKPEQLLERLGLESEDQIMPDHIATLRGMFATLKNSEATVEEMFSKTDAGGEFSKVSNPLADEEEDKKPATTGGPTAGATTEGSSAATATGGATVDPVAAARERGEKAAKAKMSRKSVPTEYLEEGRLAERNAWTEGFDAGKKPEGSSDV